jgi:hypothetical protein
MSELGTGIDCETVQQSITVPNPHSGLAGQIIRRVDPHCIGVFYMKIFTVY